MLFQLSYRPKFGGLRSDLNRYLSNSLLDAFPIKLRTHLTGVVGPEPTTFEVEARHSVQLSYTPVLLVALHDRTLRISYQSIAFSELLEGLRR